MIYYALVVAISGAAHEAQADRKRGEELLEDYFRSGTASHWPPMRTTNDR